MGIRHLLILCLLLVPTAGFAAEKDIAPKSEAMLKEWKGRFDAENFSYVAAGPFVIAGDGGAEKIARYRDKTIVAADRALRAAYFLKRPAEPVLILLFERAGPYKRLAKKFV